MSALPPRAQLATVFGGVAARLSRLSGMGEGQVIGGRVALRLQPGLLAILARERCIVLVSGTNGKTTTTRFLTAALAGLGEVATNPGGANLPDGIVTGLSTARTAPYGVLEVDEKWVPHVLRQTDARLVVMLNLSRDQLDRAAETWMLARRWHEALDGSKVQAVANADDPLVAWAASAAKQVTWVAAGQRWRDDSWCCPECGGALARDGDDWRCPDCGLRRPEPAWSLDGTALLGRDGARSELTLGLPGRANRANAVMAVAAAAALGVRPEQALRRIREVDVVAGRYRTVERKGRRLRLLLAKNPAGWLETYDVLAPPPVPVALVLNARGPDGHDTSWLWDVDFRPLRGRPVFVTGERALDLAVRLEVDGVGFTLVGSIDEAVELAPPGPVDVIANYTAFQAVRAHLGRVREDRGGEDRGGEVSRAL